MSESPRPATARTGAGGPRLKPVSWNALDPVQREIYLAVVDSRSFVDLEGSLPGPFNAMLYTPDVGAPLQELGAALRSTTSLPARAREIATLVVAAHHDSDYEWFRHAQIARSMGLEESQLAALRVGDPVVLTDPRERSVLEVTRQLLRDADLGDDDYDEAVAELGENGLVALSTLIGYYALLALQLRLFRVAAPTADPDDAADEPVPPSPGERR